MFETFDHTADVGLRITAPDLDHLFAEGARGLFAVIAGDLSQIRLTEEVSIHVQGDRLDELFFDWLDELLYRFATQHLLLAEFRVHTHEQGLEAEARGEPWNAQRHHLEHEVKAITYHGLKVQQIDSGWLAEVILDI
jgi:SHS2 domain-containing protein